MDKLFGLIDRVNDAKSADAQRSKATSANDWLGPALEWVIKKVVDGCGHAFAQSCILTGEIPLSPTLNESPIWHSLLGGRPGR